MPISFVSLSLSLITSGNASASPYHYCQTHFIFLLLFCRQNKKNHFANKIAKAGGALGTKETDFKTMESADDISETPLPQATKPKSIKDRLFMSPEGKEL